MKAFVIALLFDSLLITTSSSALAAPDWQAIEQARSAKKGNDNTAATAAALPKLTLPLDHGPHAQTTP